jgi:hypothetical protein
VAAIPTCPPEGAVTWSMVPLIGAIISRAVGAGLGAGVGDAEAEALGEGIGVGVGEGDGDGDEIGATAATGWPCVTASPDLTVTDTTVPEIADRTGRSCSWTTTPGRARASDTLPILT